MADTAGIATKEYRTELRMALRPMDGAEKLRAITALREFIPLDSTEGTRHGLVFLEYLMPHIHEAPTIGHLKRLVGFLRTMLPLHWEAAHPLEVMATLDTTEDLLQEDRDRRKGGEGSEG